MAGMAGVVGAGQVSLPDTRSPPQSRPPCVAASDFDAFDLRSGNKPALKLWGRQGQQHPRLDAAPDRVRFSARLLTSFSPQPAEHEPSQRACPGNLVSDISSACCRCCDSRCRCIGRGAGSGRGRARTTRPRGSGKGKLTRTRGATASSVSAVVSLPASVQPPRSDRCEGAEAS
eukprot:3165674-Rhodomonas_salina.2